ncbi:MAG: tetratricopeptide repeat protein [Agitococcus sp.]
MGIIPKKILVKNVNLPVAAEAVTLKKEGDRYLAVEQYEVAASYYRKALVIAPNFTDALIALAYVLTEANIVDEAAQYLQQVLSATPDNVDAHFMLGNIANSKGDLRRAIDHYIRVTNINPQFEFAYHALFGIYQAQGNSVLAKSILERAIAAIPSSSYFLFERAGLYFAEQDYQKAMTLLQKILTISPDDIACHKNMASLYIRLGKEVDAIPHLEHIITLTPDDATVYEDLANAYLKQDNKKQALRCFNEIIRLEPNSPFQHLVAAFSGETTTTAPTAYIQKLFDHYAQNFDSHLTQVLDYNVPQKLVAMIQSYSNFINKKLDVLDLGCGTGLFGQYIAPFAQHIVGVDLSANMLEKAMQHQVYQSLVQKDLLVMMKEETSATYDLIVATDVFIYVGDLEAVFAEARRLLRGQGIFAFSTEALSVDGADDSVDFRLNDAGRYEHSWTYLTKLAKKSGLDLLEVQQDVIRLEKNEPVSGHLSLWLLADD